MFNVLKERERVFASHNVCFVYTLGNKNISWLLSKISQGLVLTILFIITDLPWLLEYFESTLREFVHNSLLCHFFFKFQPFFFTINKEYIGICMHWFLRWQIWSDILSCGCVHGELWLKWVWKVLSILLFCGMGFQPQNGSWTF